MRPLFTMTAATLLLLAPALHSADWTADIPADAAAVARASSIARISEIMTATGVLKPFAEGLDRILAPLRDAAGSDVLQRNAPVTVIVLDVDDQAASAALAFLLPVTDLAAFLSLADTHSVAELPGGVYRIGPPAPDDALFCVRFSATCIVLAYSQADCLRLKGFRDSGEPSLADLLDDGERAMLAGADAVAFLRGARAAALLKRFAPEVADLLAAPAALIGARAGRPALDWLRAIDRLLWTVKASRTEGPPARNELTFDARVTPAGDSLLAALLAKWGTSDAAPALLKGAPAVVTWNLPLTSKLLEDIQQSLRSTYDAVRPIELPPPPDAQPGAVQKPVPPSPPADGADNALVAAFNKGLKPGHHPASQPAASQPLAPQPAPPAPPPPAKEAVVPPETLAARRHRDLFLRDTFLLTESVTGAGGAALLPGTAKPRLAFIAWQRVAPPGDLDISTIIAQWVDILTERVRRDGVELPVAFEPNADFVAEMTTARLGVGPVSALFLAKDDLLFLGGNLTDDSIAPLLASLKEAPPASDDSPAQCRLSASLHSAALFAMGDALTTEDRDMIERLAGVHDVRSAGVSGSLRCTGATAHIQLRLRLEDLYLAFQIIARSRQAP